MIDLPIPKHLERILNPFGNNGEYEITGKIVCDCGAENFIIKLAGDDSKFEIEKVIKVAEIENNFYLIVLAECNECSKEHLIFDKDFHGWNGFVCGENSKNIARPPKKNWNCKCCNSTKHSLNVSIQSQGKNDFKLEAGDEFDTNDWTEGFSWITINLTCNSCNELYNEWISYETM